MMITHNIKLSPKDWLAALLDPEKANSDHGLDLPSFPTDHIQCMYTGNTREANMQQAYQFYSHVLSLGVFDGVQNPRLMDFGAGWGRITRFFLRHAAPGNIWAVDRMANSLEIMKGLGFKVNFVHGDRLPPLQLDGVSGFNLITAYSVFSHLSEQLADAWLDHLYQLLAPGGTLVYTTRGERFIWQLECSERGENPNKPRGNLPKSDEIRRRWEAGEFQFYSTGGGGPELAEPDYGQAWIPPQWIRRKHGDKVLDLRENVPYVDQLVVAVRKPAVR